MIGYGQLFGILRVETPPQMHHSRHQCGRRPCWDRHRACKATTRRDLHLGSQQWPRLGMCRHCRRVYELLENDDSSSINPRSAWQ